VNHVFATGADFDGDDMSGKFGGEGDFAALAQGAVFGHEKSAAASDTFDGAEDSAAAGELGVGGELDGTGHPGKFARLGDDGLVGLEDEFEDGHGGADDAALHEVSLASTEERAGISYMQRREFCDSLGSTETKGLNHEGH